MKSQLISSMSSFVLGTGATLVALASWLGTTDLQTIKDSVQNYVVQSEQHSSALVEEYNVTVDQANAEISDYKVALQQANDNISQLITAYEEEQAQAEQDLADLQEEYDKMVQKINLDYKLNMNEVIEQANTQINKANQEVQETRVEVQGIIGSSHLEDIVNSEKHELDTTGSKEVTDISSVVPQE